MKPAVMRPLLLGTMLSVLSFFRGVQRRHHYFVGVVREITDALLMAGEMLK